MYPFVMTGKSLVIVVDGEAHTLSEGQDNYNLVVQGIKDDDEDVVKNGISLGKAVQTFLKGDIEFADGIVTYKGVEIHNNVVNRIKDFMREGLPVNALLNFLSNLLSNPSYNSRNQFYEFLEHKNLPITDDGFFLAYKCVQKDFLSKASGNEPVLVIRPDGEAETQIGKIDNSIGNTIKLDRTLIDDNPNTHCSVGLHIGNLTFVKEYLSSYGNNVIIVKCNPRDVVSVPNDEQCRKVRVCEYQVLETYKGALPDSYNTSSTGYADDWIDQTDWEDEIEDED